MFKLIKNCRICNSDNILSILNLGNQSLANSFQKKIIRQKAVPLNLLRCSDCFTLQLSATVKPSYLFSKYLWVTGTSEEVKKYRNYFVKKIKSFHLSHISFPLFMLPHLVAEHFRPSSSFNSLKNLSLPFHPSFKLPPPTP